MNNNSVETVVGALVIAIAAVFFFYVYTTTGKSIGGGGYHVSAEFDNIGTVNVGTDVRVAGIKVGTVTNQDLDPDNYQARITMTINPKVKISDDASAKITSEGLLGANYIAIDPGGSETKLEDGGEIVSTQGAVDFWKLINDTMFSRSGSGGGGSGGGSGDNSGGGSGGGTSGSTGSDSGGSGTSDGAASPPATNAQ